MIKIAVILLGLAGSILLADPASACVLAPPQPRLAGESDFSYQARVEKMSREIDEQRSIQRQQSALKAPILFIAREASTEFFQQETAKWAAAQPKPKRGDPPVPPVPPPPQFPIASYFQPVTWIKGTGSPAIFRIETRLTTCGPWSLGDTGAASDGDLLVFFAQEGPISEKTLIDAITIDKLTEPELVELVARHREDPGAGADTPEPHRR